jgi:hypothetical protein
MFVPEGPGLGIEMIEEEVVEQAIEVATLNYRR